MVRILCTLAVIWLGPCVLTGCSYGPDMRTIFKASAVTVYEGLPHQMYEGKLLRSEKKRKPTVDRQGFPFYEETLTLKPNDVEKLKSILCNSQSFHQYTSGKKCGDFHPDFAVAWSDNGGQNEWLICFGCGESRLHGPSGSTYYDMVEATRTQLKDILAPYRQNRPAHVMWGVWIPSVPAEKELHADKVGKYVIGKSTLKEILGDDPRQARQRFATQGLIFQFDKGEKLSGITVTTGEYPTQDRLMIVGMTEEQIQGKSRHPLSTTAVPDDAKTLGTQALTDGTNIFILNDDQIVSAIKVTGATSEVSN